jgi:hypothetical protein
MNAIHKAKEIKLEKSMNANKTKEIKLQNSMNKNNKNKRN